MTASPLKADILLRLGGVSLVPILLQKSGIVVARLLRRFAEAVFSHPAL
jgi:hypothetical protein